MRCQRWPDSRCYSPVACGGFGYCRERNWDYNGRPVDPEPFKAAWQKQDDDGMPAGYSYEAAHKA